MVYTISTGSVFGQKLENKQCHAHDEYTNITSAMAICLSDANCFGIGDTNCDGEGTVTLCDLHPKTIGFLSGGCIYVRSGRPSKRISQFSAK